MREHEVKIWPGAFKLLRDGLKTCEWRSHDRDYRAGDVVILREWSPRIGQAGARELMRQNPELPIDGAYTGEVEKRSITHVLEGGEFGLPRGFCVLSLSRD